MTKRGAKGRLWGSSGVQLLNLLPIHGVFLLVKNHQVAHYVCFKFHECIKL
jgi:hypothetical protein